MKARSPRPCRPRAAAHAGTTDARGSAAGESAVSGRGGGASAEPRARPSRGAARGGDTAARDGLLLRAFSFPGWGGEHFKIRVSCK